jgi:hypothetical protein
MTVYMGVECECQNKIGEGNGFTEIPGSDTYVEGASQQLWKVLTMTSSHDVVQG